MKYPMIYPKAPPMTENIVQLSAVAKNFLGLK